MFFDHIPIISNELDRSIAILEIGCGNGRNIKHVMRSGNPVFTIDISESAYNANRQYDKTDNVFIVRCDGNKLPFRNGQFDLIFSDHVLRHIPDLDECLKEIERVADKENRIYFNLYSKENNFIMTHIVEPIKKYYLNKIPIGALHLLSNIPALILWSAIKLIYEPILTNCKGLYKYLPLADHMTFWLRFDYRIIRQTVFDLLHAPFAYYFSGSDIEDLAKSSGLILTEKKLLR
jgi:SAM-dependent methyltransferase